MSTFNTYKSSFFFHIQYDLQYAKVPVNTFKNNITINMFRVILAHRYMYIHVRAIFTHSVILQ